MNIDVFSFTDPGGREYNEDALGMREVDGGSVFVVADGLGGHLHGEVASACAVQTILDTWEQEQDLLGCLTAANQKILQLQEESPGKMKTTAVCLFVGQDSASWAHVGDSRLYYFHNSALWAYTADHSVAYKKYLSGEITRGQIATDEDQSSLLRALGNPTRNQGELAQSGLLEAGDGFLLCSDGLWEYLRDQEILTDLLKTTTARQWAQQLLLRVMERVPEDNDNLSLIAVRILQ